MSSELKMLYVAPYCFGLETSLGNAFESKGLTVVREIYGQHSKEKSRLERLLFDRLGYGVVRAIRTLLGRVGLTDFRVWLQLWKFNRRMLKLHRELKPDWVFIVKGELFFKKTLLEMKQSSKVVVYYWDDPFLRFAREIAGRSDLRFENVKKNASVYDVSFVYDPSYIDELKKQGAQKVEFLMDWYEPELYRPMNLSDEERKVWGADIAFVGSPYDNRVELLAALDGYNLGVWGPLFRWKEYFKKYPSIQKAYRGEAAGENTAKIYNASKIVLNIHDQAQCKESVNNRTFQILACSAFELLDHRTKAEELFKLGEDLDTFRSADDLRNKVEDYLRNEALRSRVKESGHFKSKFHSSEQRVDQIMNALAQIG